MPAPTDLNNVVLSNVPINKSILVARNIQSPNEVLMPYCTNDPFLIVDSPPNSGVIFGRTVPASASSVQLDFFGIVGFNRAYMSICNNSPESDLLVNLNFGPASPTNFTERLEPGETWRLPLSWVKFGGPVTGIWVPAAEVVSAVKFARLRATAAGDTTIVPGVPGAQIRVLGYGLTAATALLGATVDLFFKSGSSTDLGGIRALSGTYPVSYGGGLEAPAFQTAVGQAFVVGLTAARSVDGHLNYVEVRPGTATGDAQVIELL